MGFLSRLFGNKKDNSTIRKRKNQPDVINIPNEDDRMNWAMQKAKLTLHFFEENLKQPKPEQQYFSVKIQLEDNGKVEHIWLVEPHFDDDGNLFGTIGNEPIDIKTVKFNQKIGVEKEIVSDWMIIENGRLIGGYTIRAIRDGLSGKDIEAFDQSIGGVFVDEGDDYLLPNNNYPECAILQIEEAYDNDDIQAAIACKDFNKEAQLMLSKINPKLSDEETINQTAEVLQLAFVQSLNESGMPKYKNVIRAFPKREIITENHYIITEICKYPDGTKSIQRINAYKTNGTWKVGAPEE